MTRSYIVLAAAASLAMAALSSTVALFTEAISVVKRAADAALDFGLALVATLFETKRDDFATDGWEYRPELGIALPPALLNGMRHEAGMRPAPG